MQMNVNTVLLTSQFIGQQRLDYVELQNIVHIFENITLASYSFSGFSSANIMVSIFSANEESLAQILLILVLFFSD